MQRPAALRLNLSTERHHGSKDAWLRGVRRHTIGAPPGIIFPVGVACMPPVPHALWSHTQEMDKEETHHQLEDKGLTDGVASQALHHLAIGR